MLEPAMKLHPATLTILLAATLACELAAQRRFPRPGQGGRRPEAAAPAPAAPKPTTVERWVAITNGDVHTGTGQVLRGATVLIGDDKIHAVGHDLVLPDKVEIVDAKGRVVAPGYVAVKGNGMGAPRATGGKVQDGVNAFDPSIKQALAAGITSFLVTLQNGSDKPDGKNAVVKLAYGDVEHMVVAENGVLSMSVPLNAMQWKTLRDLVDKAKEHKKALAEHAAKAAPQPASPAGAQGAPGGGQEGPGGRPRGGEAAAGAAPKAPAGIENVLKVLNGEARLWITCRGRFDTAELRQALQVGALFDVPIVVDDPITAWTIPDEVAAANAMVVLNPRNSVDRDPAQPDTTGSNIAQAAILAAAGVPVAVTPPGGMFGGATVGTGGILGQDLNVPQVDAAYAVRGGLDNRKALRTLTLDAARILGVESRIGSLEEGKDADVLILDGDPLHYKTFVQTAIVNGKVVYVKDDEPYYSHIKR